jgi:hypothetical protein
MMRYLRLRLRELWDQLLGPAVGVCESCGEVLDVAVLEQYEPQCRLYLQSDPRVSQQHAGGNA